MSASRVLTAGPAELLVPAVVVLAGATGSGKSTLAQSLATDGGLGRLAASSLLLKMADAAPQSKRKRLWSWLADPVAATARRCADTTADRATDLAVLAACRAATKDVVVETAGPAALLQPVDTLALLVLLDAPAPVRAARLQRTLAGTITLSRASRIVVAKDAATMAAVRAAWALDLSDLAAVTWRFDLVIRCPDATACRRPDECRQASRELATVAVSVYQHYLSSASADEPAWHMSAVAERWRPWLVRLSPALIDPDGPHTPDRWRHRLSDELAELVP